MTSNTQSVPDAIQSFQAAMLLAMPGAVIDIDHPANVEGEWWIDIESGTGYTNLSWMGERGFGIYAHDAAFGERPTTHTADPSEAVTLAVQQMTGVGANVGTSVDATEDAFDAPIGGPRMPPQIIDPVAQAEIDGLRKRLREARSQLWREWVERGSEAAYQAFEATKAGTPGAGLDGEGERSGQ